jgi:anti-sigma factor RsiW
VDEHLKDCPACRQQLASYQALSAALDQPGLRYAASDTLKQRIRNKLKEADAEERRPAWPRWAAAAAVAVLVVGMGWNYLPHPGASGEDEDDVMVDAAVDQQEHAAETQHLTDLASTDSATLSAWFKGKLPFEPKVADLKALGYELVGGRLDTVHGQPAAALTYRHDAEIVTVFVCAAQKGGDMDLDTDDDDGYHIVYWTQGPLSFWVVSKLDAAPLKTVASSIQQAG